MMKKIILSLALALVTSQAVTINAAEALFNKNEVGITLGSSHSQDVNNRWGADFGLRAFPLNKYAGLQASAGFRDVDSGPVVDDTRLEGILRLPLDKYRLALEVVGGARYDLDEKDYQWSVGPRLGYRFNKNVEVFAGYRYNFARQSLALQREVPFGISFNF